MIDGPTDERDGGGVSVADSSSAGWLDRAVRALEVDGCVVVHNVLSGQLQQSLREAMGVAQTGIDRDIGRQRLLAAKEIGVLRAPMSYDPRFYDLLALPQVLAILDATVSSTAILHLQNGLVLPPANNGRADSQFQHSFHRDFPRHLNGYLASINTIFAIDDFNDHNGATLVVPGSHQLPARPDETEMRLNALPVVCPAGSMIVFDSTLWHAAGQNLSSADRLAVNQQFTRSFVKQQLDYVRLLGDHVVASLPQRTQQLLGWYTRVVTSLDEYYQPADRRLYRAGQG